MPFAYTIHEQAYHEYIQAYEWYELKQKGLGNKFSAAVEKRLNNISANPEHYSKVRGNFRQALLPGFPFTIVYEFFPRSGTLYIAAIYHTRRKPSGRYRKSRK